MQKHAEPGREVGDGVAERLALGSLDYEIPVAANRWTYMLGGLTAVFLALLFATGLYLAQFYNPTPIGAHDSVLYIIARAPFGDWIRSLHYWSAAAAVVTIVAHLAYVFWRRSYRRPREVTWWAGVAMAGVIFLLLVTGAALRYDQEGIEALAHFVSGGEKTGLLGVFFTAGFTRSTTLLSRIFSLHTSLLPLLLLALMGLHFWLIRQLGIHADYSDTTVFRTHARRLVGAGLLAFATVGLLAILAPEGIGYAGVPGAEVTKPFWPVLWVYGLENLLGSWGMILGPAFLFGFLAAVPLLDRRQDDTPGPSGVVGWFALFVAVAVLLLWLYGMFGARQQHLGM